MVHLSLCSIALGFIGFLFAAKVARRLGHRRRGGRCAGGSRFLGKNRFLRRLFFHLDTTPGQEREIRASLDELRERAADAARGVREAKASLGKSLEGEVFDEAAFEALSARIDAASAQMKDAAAGALRRVHAVLDPSQRARLAALLARGPGWGRVAHAGGGFGGPYR